MMSNGDIYVVPLLVLEAPQIMMHDVIGSTEQRWIHCYGLCHLLPLVIFWSLIGCPMMWCRVVIGGSDEAGPLLGRCRHSTWSSLLVLG